MSNLANTVSILSILDEQPFGSFLAVTISSLVSSSVNENEEEVMFVLKNDSLAEIRLAQKPNFSINVLADSASQIATLYGSSPRDRIQQNLIDNKEWIIEESVPKFLEAHVFLKCEYVESIRRFSSTIIFARVKSLDIHKSTYPLIHFQRSYCRLNVSKSF
jgi:flavin reductase (DIM6/NTAB) family NADH-FMN oxidoreductase RutF